MHCMRLGQSERAIHVSWSIAWLAQSERAFPCVHDAIIYSGGTLSAYVLHGAGPVRAGDTHVVFHCMDGPV